MILINKYPVTIFVTLIASTLFLKTNACIYKKLEDPKPQPSEKPWNMEIHPRQIETFMCDCGGDHLDPYDNDSENDAYYKSWFVVIHVFENYPSGFIRSCMGTVINSIMILTSHNCLRLSDGKVGAYETWNLEPTTYKSVFAKEKNIRFSRYEDPLQPLETFMVKEIIYNQDWISSEVRKSQPDGDIVILVVDTHWPLYLPICVPQWNEPYDPTGFTGYYYGVGGEFRTDPNPELRSIGNAFVLPGKICDKSIRLNGFSSNETLCIQSRLMSPKTTGGPLIMAENGIVNSEGYTPGETVFLLGLASAIKQHKDDDLIVTTYFSNIFRWIRYLEYHAYKQGARWCNTPKIQLDSTFRNTDFKQGLTRRYIWDVGPPSKQDESLDCVCGLHNLEKDSQQSRIIGGEKATPYEFPWLTFLDVYYPTPVGVPFSSYTCGGSIINNKLILTAAHCVIERRPEHESNEWVANDINVWYSIHNTSAHSDDGVGVRATKVHLYRDYVKGLHESYIDYDVALLELEKPLQFSTAKQHGEAKQKDVRPICLPRIGKPIVVVGRNATVAGWGLMPDPLQPGEYKPSEELFKLQKPILPLEACGRSGDVKVRDTVLCAGYLNRSRDSSRGDSGGPLAIRTDNGYWTQVGVVSYGADFYDPYDIDKYSHTTALYANVQKFLRFINYFSNKVGAKWCKSYV